MASRLILTAMVLTGLANPLWAADPPCDKYPPGKQRRCMEIWHTLNQKDAPVIAQFGLDQLKRRENGEITAEQHLAQNMEFIKQSTAKRLVKLKELMAKE